MTTQPITQEQVQFVHPIPKRTLREIIHLWHSGDLLGVWFLLSQVCKSTWAMDMCQQLHSLAEDSFHQPEENAERGHPSVLRKTLEEAAQQIQTQPNEWNDTLFQRFVEEVEVESHLEWLKEPVAQLQGELDQNAPIRVALLGEFSSGKSRLINALLRKKILSIGIVPVTCAITRVVYAPEEQISIHYLDGTIIEGDIADVRAYIDERKSNRQEKTIKEVVIGLPSPLLSSIELIDTPGFNSGNELHEQVANQLLLEADAILWIIAAHQVGSQTEETLLSRVRRVQGKVLAVINQVDRLSGPEEVAAQLHEARTRFAHSIKGVIATSAKWIEANDTEGNEASLLQEIQELGSMSHELRLQRRQRRMLNLYRLAVAHFSLKQMAKEQVETHLDILDEHKVRKLEEAQQLWKDMLSLREERTRKNLEKRRKELLQSAPLDSVYLTLVDCSSEATVALRKSTEYLEEFHIVYTSYLKKDVELLWKSWFNVESVEYKGSLYCTEEPPTLTKAMLHNLGQLIELLIQETPGLKSSNQRFENYPFVMNGVGIGEQNGLSKNYQEFQKHLESKREKVERSLSNKPSNKSLYIQWKESHKNIVCDQHLWHCVHEWNNAAFHSDFPVLLQKEEALRLLRNVYLQLHKDLETSNEKKTFIEEYDASPLFEGGTVQGVSALGCTTGCMIGGSISGIAGASVGVILGIFAPLYIAFLGGILFLILDVLFFLARHCYKFPTQTRFRWIEKELRIEEKQCNQTKKHLLSRIDEHIEQLKNIKLFESLQTERTVKTHPIPDHSSSSSSAVTISEWTGLNAGQSPGEVRSVDALPHAVIVWVPPGRYTIELVPLVFSPERKRPQTTITLKHGFWIWQHPVTVEQFLSVLPDGSSAQSISLTPGNAAQPVTNISWLDALRFCNALSRNLGLEACFDESIEAPFSLYNQDYYKNPGVRLPTETEWEYSCRAGSQDMLYGPLDAIAWYDDNSNSELHPVMQKQPNAFGLYDMIGNVWEWCWDEWSEHYEGSIVTPRGIDDNLQVIRGGSWDSESWATHAASRRPCDCYETSPEIGFRPVITGL